MKLPDTISNGNVYAGTFSGAFLSVFSNMFVQNLLKTIILAFVGAVVSFIVSLVLKNFFRHKKNLNYCFPVWLPFAVVVKPPKREASLL